MSLGHTAAHATPDDTGTANTVDTTEAADTSGPAGTALGVDAGSDAIAVIGLACRLPGAAGPAEFWHLLREGRSAVATAPAERGFTRTLIAETGPDAAARFGAFLADVGGFDADFFGMSPREAAAADPQQRLVLELAWEAMEDAGLRPAALRGSRTGVFVGAIADDYAALTRARGPRALGRHTLTGLNRGIIANRVSYTFDLHGPSLTVDTAQSSSLVAVHLACESLRSGESELALAAGVSLALAPEGALGAARFGALSPDGRCFTFDARANGYVRGEGAGLVLLKPLARALADGDRVVCVIRGSATNNDGTTDGLTVPGEATQTDVIRRAWSAARLDPATAGYVELHGTGTRVGDPIEAAALGAALGAARPAGDPLPVGSAKTNVGHLEGAAGIVGLLKTALALRHRTLPATLNHDTAHPGIPLAELGLRVQVEPGPWAAAADRPLAAGVSSFGMGGTNCHVVLTEAPGGSDEAGAPGADAGAAPRWRRTPPTWGQVPAPYGPLPPRRRAAGPSRPPRGRRGPSPGGTRTPSATRPGACTSSWRAVPPTAPRARSPPTARSRWPCTVRVRPSTTGRWWSGRDATRCSTGSPRPPPVSGRRGWSAGWRSRPARSRSSSAARAASGSAWVPACSPPIRPSPARWKPRSPSCHRCCPGASTTCCSAPRGRRRRGRGAA